MPISQTHFLSLFHSLNFLVFFSGSVWFGLKTHTECFWTKLIFKFSIYFTGVGLLLVCILLYLYLYAGYIFITFSSNSLPFMYWHHIPSRFNYSHQQHLHLLEKSSSSLSPETTRTNVSVIRWNSSQNYEQWAISFAKVHDLIFVYIFIQCYIYA